jgi:hypothetical protein
MLFIIGLAAAQYSLDTNISIESVQSVDGTGFFSSYRSVNMPDPLGNLEGVTGQGLSGMAAKHLAHGSGQISDKSKIHAYNYYNETGIVLVQGGVELEPVIDDDNITALLSIGIREDTSMTYNPSFIALERGYYARNPIIRRSLPADRTFIKNLDTGSKLHNEIEYAKAFRKELEAQADYVDLANTAMELDETITEGMVKIGALQHEELPTFREREAEKGSEEPWDEEEPEMVSFFVIEKSKPQIEMDEMYIGSFHIKKSMVLATFVDGSDEEDEIDEWLPCCYQGFDDLEGLDSEYLSIEKIFDCTCYKAIDKEMLPK